MSIRNNDKLVKAVVNSKLPAEKPTQNNIVTILDALTLGKNIRHIDEDLVESLGRSGVTVKNACSLLHKGFDFFTLNPTMQQAYDRGRASLGSSIRSKLIEAALENGNIQSAIHLDKIYSGDSVTEVNITVGQSQLSAVSDDDLMKVAFTVDSDEDIDRVSTMNPTVEKGVQGGDLGGGGHTPEE